MGREGVEEGERKERTASPDQSGPKGLHTFISEAKGLRAHFLVESCPTFLKNDSLQLYQVTNIFLL